MAQKNTLDRLLDTILEKATSEGIKKSLHSKSYRVEGHTSKYDPLFQETAGYAMQMGEYRVFVQETSIRMQYPGDTPKDKPLLPDDNGKRMCLTLKRGNKKVLEAHKFIWERKQLRNVFKKWVMPYNKAVEDLLESLY